ncbi:hypothetical protein [Streptomyces scabiei]|jgi:hypothetical protein|uniref:hypothetical protein n=1 Tax=Streptomyces scabiei TaxID=1930 RepID=UPI00076604B8|nr:hypothetical protein [Streptomyces scabiei]
MACCDKPEGAVCVHDAITLPQLTDEQREALARQTAEFHGAMARIAAVAIPAFQAIVEAFNQLGRQLREAGLIDEDGKPVKAADRPAWQSPYGPPSRRR